ncbi:MAG: HAMP domain-containing histidine kinase [Clostridiales bacterium]|jgi:signal transduction histidine kinase|nr:HAMP domain-containing histidine kinase [Clostridiales bacterium]
MENTIIENRTAKRGLYALLEVLAVSAGTLTAMLCAITFGVANLMDVSRWSAEKLEDMAPGSWAAEFASGHAQADFTSRFMTITVICGLLALASVVGLCVLTGRFARDEEGKIKLNWFDRLWSELHLVIGCASATGAVFAAMPVARMISCSNKVGPFDLSKVFSPVEADGYMFGISNDAVFWYCTAGIAACLAIVVVCFITLVKKLKAHELIHSSLTGKIFGMLGIGAAFAGRGVAKAGKGLAKAGQDIAVRNKSATRRFTIPNDEDRRAAQKLIIKYSLIAVVLIGLPVFFMIMSGEYEWMLFWVLVSFVLAIVLIVRKVGKLAEIRAGVIEVKSGNLTHKISVKEDENGPKTDLDKLASDINHISEATNAAVQNEIKNQRLKTDLISNVSHDLKTPLTSMVSYLDILEKEGLDSPDAPAHLAIVKEKTERLKTLTEELFEAAKASSGNIPCEIEDIDVSALIDQSLAEMGDRLAKKKLTIKKNIRTDNTLVRADGKLLYRVFENLLSNISKYALDRSRVYIDVSEASTAKDKLLVEVKNISKAELNISPDELMERFTRGDSSRNTEGSGLGLAIAKDLTTLMGGVFEISIDGDMFKASVMLDRA